MQIFLFVIIAILAVNRVSAKGWNWGDHTQPPKWLTTQSSGGTPSSTRVTTTMSTTDAKPDFETCFSTCLVTRELRPVCGSNGVTYTNKRQLDCAKTCGLVVTLEYTGRCEDARTPTISPTTRAIYETMQSVATTTISQSIQKCIKRCPTTGKRRPVCGSNGETYKHIQLFNCVVRCGLKITVANRGKCENAQTVSPIITRPTYQTTRAASTTPISLSVKKCIKRCSRNDEYKPVCGSNGQSYKNIELLNCVLRCGLKIKLSYDGPCNNGTPSTVSPITDISSSETTDPITSSTPLTKQFEGCIKSCPVTPEYNRVCGSNGQTYKNIGHLRCANRCGLNVIQSYSGPCGNVDINPSSSVSPSTEITSETTPIESSTTPSKAVQECMTKCPLTPEYNPVCGTNSQTYKNLGTLQCAKRCGLDVNVRFYGPCVGRDDKTASTESPVTSGTTPMVNACITKCRTTPEYNPVCGTNRQTYKNIGNLNCAQGCGLDVMLLFNGPCVGRDDRRTSTSAPIVSRNGEDPSSVNQERQECFTNCPATNEYNPICGTNGQTYSNKGHLECAKSCGLDVDMQFDAPCVGREDKKTSTTSTEDA